MAPFSFTHESTKAERVVFGGELVENPGASGERISVGGSSSSSNRDGSCKIRKMWPVE